MHWKLKAKIQNAVAWLPASASYETYYRIQRYFGGLRRLNPISRLTAGIETWKRIQKQGWFPSGKVFFEVGTGRVPLVPLAFWLMGAKKTITIDLNPYLKEELIADALGYISNHEEEILNLFGSLINKNRLDQLLEFGRSRRRKSSEVLDLARIEYMAPGDAAATRLPERSIDFHASYTVFEHIPKTALKRILEEGNRIIRDDGLFVHRIDYSDHFSHSDKSISAINFLQYSDAEWERYAGNRYMYMNRLRQDDFVDLFESVGHLIVETETNTDTRVHELLRNGNLHLNERFSSKPQEVLEIRGAWMITRKNG